MYGQRHPLPYQATQGEKLVANFTAKQTGWLLAGGFLSYKMLQYVPPLPFDSFVFQHIHQLIPLGLCAIFGFAKEGKTGLPLFTYCYHWIGFHRRRRTLTYKRGTGN